MHETAPHRDRFEALAAVLEVVASPTRLEILHALREPKTVTELRVSPSRSREGHRDDRPLARQTVSHHLEQLEAAGLVQRSGDALVLDQSRLFAIVDEVRNLAKLRRLSGDVPAGATVAHAAGSEARLPSAPRLVVAFGQDDGIAYPLRGAEGASWRIGRVAPCEIRLDYDPYVSTENCVIERTHSGFTVRDLGSRNGTWLDWSRLPPKAERALAPGTLLGVGRTILVFQP